MRILASLGKESVYSIPPKEESSQQLLYSKEIITCIIGEDQEGFNSRISKQQTRKGYPLVKGVEIQLKSVQQDNNRPLKNTPRVKQAGELKTKEVEPSQIGRAHV